MQDTLLAWIMTYILTAMSVIYFMDDIPWPMRIIFGILWPLTASIIIILLMFELIKN